MSLQSFRPRSWTIWRALPPGFSVAKEVSAGLSVGLIALPLALALGIASIPAGTETPLPPPALGLFTAVIAGFLISFLGGSRVQIGGPTAAFVPILLLIVTEHGYQGLILATMMAGVIQVALGLSGMGRLIKFIPWPVTSGFTTGIAVSLILTQIPAALGLNASEAPPREFAEKIHWLFTHVATLDLLTTLLGIATVVGILLWPRLPIKFCKALPGSIAVLLAVTVGVALLHFAGTAQGVATIGSTFGPGAIPAELPSIIWPDWDWGLVRDLIGPATAVALLGSIESLLSAVVADGLSGDRHDSSTELVAQGIANIICPFFGGLPATGAIARTSANVHHGATTPLAGMIHAATLMVIILVAARWAIHIPMAAMAGVLIVVALRMGEWHELQRLKMLPASDALVLLTTFGLTVVFDLVIAVEVGMVLAAFLYIKRVSETTEVSQVTQDDVLERPEHIAQGKAIPEGVLVYRIFGPFMFGAAEKMEDALSSWNDWPRVLILRLHLVTAMDTTGLNALESVIERIHARGGLVILSGIHRQPLDMLRKAGFLDSIGRENLCATFDDALQRSREILGTRQGA